MSKVIIEIEDKEDGEISLNVKFDPKVDYNNLTPAQQTALEMIQSIATENEILGTEIKSGD